MVDFVTDENVLNNISDDMIYLRDLVKREKKLGLSLFKEAHLGRLAVVISYNSAEAHRDYLARSMGITRTIIDWNSFFDSELKEFMEAMIEKKIVNFKNLKDVKTVLFGLKALRDFISHGLVDGSARDYEKKIRALRSSGLFINPSKLTINDVDNILDFDYEITNLMGMSHSLWGINS